MFKNSRPLIGSLLMASFLTGALVFTWLALGIQINTSGSVAGSLYRANVYKPSTREQYVFICPPKEFVVEYGLLQKIGETGRCGGAISLLKRVIAIRGDKLAIGRNGITVNDSLLPLTKPYETDRSGNALPFIDIDIIVPEGFVAVIGDTAKSYDSRYFGLIDEKWITGEAIKVF